MRGPGPSPMIGESKWENTTCYVTFDPQNGRTGDHVSAVVTNSWAYAANIFVISEAMIIRIYNLGK